MSEELKNYSDEFINSVVRQAIATERARAEQAEASVDRQILTIREQNRILHKLREGKEQAKKQFGTCSECGFCAWKDKDNTTEECQFCVQLAELERLRAENLKLKIENNHNWTAVDAVEEMAKERDELRTQLAVANKTASFFASVIKSGEPWTTQCDNAIAQLNPALTSASEAFRVPEPHDMDCSSRRGDCCDCDRAKA